MRGKYCVRCARAAPARGHPEYVEWEAVSEDGEMLCPDCLAGMSSVQIDSDAMDMAAETLGLRSRGRLGDASCEVSAW
jgi:hypothetical protein